MPIGTHQRGNQTTLTVHFTTAHLITYISPQLKTIHISKFSNTILILTRPLRGFLLFYPIVVGRVVPVVGKANPRPSNANAGVPVVIVTDPSSREISRPPGFGKLAHSAGGHGTVTL